MIGIAYVSVLVPLSAAALFLAPTRPEYLVAAHIVAGALNGGLGLWLISRLVPIRFRGLPSERVRALLGHALPVGISGFIAVLTLRAGIFLLNFLSGPDAVANFVAAQRFLDLGAAVAVTAVTPLITIFGRISGTGSSDEIAVRILTATLWIALPVPLIACFWSAPVVDLLYGADLQKSADILPIVALQFTQFAIATSLSLWILTTISSKGLQIFIWGPLAALVTNVALSLLLIPALNETARRFRPRSEKPCSPAFCSPYSTGAQACLLPAARSSPLDVDLPCWRLHSSCHPGRSRQERPLVCCSTFWLRLPVLTAA